MKFRIYQIILLLIISSAYACNEETKKTDESAIPIFVINTESLDESISSHNIKNGRRRYEFKFGGVVSNREARFGDKSIKLNQKYKYGNNIVLDDLIENEFIEVSIWRKDKFHNAALVVEGIDHNFYHGEMTAYQKWKDGWEELRFGFIVPLGLTKVKIYTYTGKSKEAFFDGLKIKKFKTANYPSVSIDNESKLFFSPRNMQRFAEKRSNSLSIGVNINDGDWMGGILFHNETGMPIKARLKGDWLDHLVGGKWSFRIKVKDDYTFERMKVFSLQNPGSRSYLFEYVSHKIFQQEGILTTRYGFTNASLNGSASGLYAYEEHFTKQLIEYNLRREGPILKFDEDPMWLTEALRKKNPYLKNTRINMPAFFSSRVLPFGNIDPIESPGLYNQFLIGQSILEQYKNRTADLNDILDLEKFAQYSALLDLFQGYHGKAWHNQRFYYNPVLCKLEPINYDNYTDYFDSNTLRPLLYTYYGSRPEKHPSHNFEEQIFGHGEFLGYYLHYLRLYSSKNFINAFFDENKDGLKTLNEAVLTEFPIESYDFNYLNKRAKDIRKKIPELQNFIRGKDYLKSTQADAEIYYKEISIEEMLPSFINTYYYKNEGNNNLLIENYNTIPIRPVALCSKNKRELVNLGNTDLITRFNSSCGKIELKVPFKEKVSFISFTTKDSDSIIYAEITPWKKSTELSPYQKIKKSFNINNSKLFKNQGDSLIITAQKHTISEKVLVPPHRKLVIEAGAEIDIVNKGSLISYSPIFALGTKDKPILVHSSDSTANGFVVLQATEKSKLTYIIFKNLNTLNYEGWVLTGAVNFYESDVELSNCEFISNHCEDALNIVRSDFKVDKARFYNIYADAFDSDFCTGELANSVFEQVDNDAIDFSTSQITIKDCKINNILDKGISGGEQSTLKVYNTTITNCNIGAASKDLSEVDLINVSITNCNYGLVALRKKPEYGPAKIFTEGLQMTDCSTEELLEEYSELNREGNIKKGYRKNVAAMFY